MASISLIVMKTGRGSLSSRRTGCNLVPCLCWLLLLICRCCAQRGNCNFDIEVNSNRICSWRNADPGEDEELLQDDLQWRVFHGSTPGPNSGPKADHTTGDLNKGYYIYLYTPPGISLSAPNLVVLLVSETFPASSSDACMHFWYHMYGDQIEILQVFLYKTGSRRSLLWNKQGNQGSRWISGQVNIPQTSSSYQIVFRAVRGCRTGPFAETSALLSDIALDDISFTIGNCIECPGGRWGSNCSRTCGNCLNNEPCGQDGLCRLCVPGYQQAHCVECAHKAYSPSTKQCKPCGKCANNADCNKYTGRCQQCQSNFKPPFCQECVDRYYWHGGANYWDDGVCQSCGHCLGNAICSRVNGDCPRRAGQQVCADGYHGRKCDTACEAGRYGPNCQETCGECQEGLTSCRYTDGYCQSCLVGFQPPLCQQCLGLFYGKNCSQDCGQCAENRHCNYRTGDCDSCVPGRKPHHCKQACDDGFYGQDCLLPCGNCNNSEVCSKTDGLCPGDCIPGYKLPLCQKECDDGFYGDCKSKCGFCVEDLPCDKVTGDCTYCLPGYKSPLCQECDDGFYGDCKSKCGLCSEDKPCDNITGTCTSCLSGYRPPRCQECMLEEGCTDIRQVTSSTASSMNTFTISIVFISCGIVLLIAIIAALMVRHRQKKKKAAQNLQINVQFENQPSSSSKPISRDEGLPSKAASSEHFDEDEDSAVQSVSSSSDSSKTDIAN